jgi:hypothetical protein
VSSTNKPQTVKASAVDVWGARGPQGTIVRSSISNYKSVAKRWADKRGPAYKLIHITFNLKDVPDFEIQAKLPKTQKVTDAKKLGIIQGDKKKAAVKKTAGKKATQPKKTVSARKATKSASPATRRKRVQAAPESGQPIQSSTVTEESGVAL